MQVSYTESSKVALLMTCIKTRRLRDKMADILQMRFSGAFYCMENILC